MQQPLGMQQPFSNSLTSEFGEKENEHVRVRIFQQFADK
jgi:hypothetical protein